MDRFKDQTKIGEGAFGEVFMATDKITETLYALKKFKVASDESVLSELGALMKVNHSGIVRFKSMIQSDDGYTWLQMEYCDGGNLDTFWKTKKPNLNVKHSFMTEISEAVRHLHENGIAHRDLKPENILVSYVEEGYHPKLGDFGVAKVLGTNETSKHVMSTKIGTPFFMAPEMFDPKIKQYTLKVDIFSLGIIFRAMLFDRFIQPSGEPFLGDCYYAEGVIEVAWGAALFKKPDREFDIDAKQLKNFRLRNILDMMLAPKSEKRPSAKDVAITIGTLKPEDFYVETGLQRTKSMPEGSGRKVVVPVAGVRDLHLSEGASANPGQYATIRELSHTMQRVLESQKKSPRHPSRTTTPLRRSFAVQEEQQPSWRTAPTSRPPLQRAATSPAAAPENQLGLTSADIMDTKQLVAMWEDSLKTSANPLQLQQLKTTTSVLTKSLNKIERGQSLNEDEMKGFSSAWSSMDELMQLEEHDNMFD